MDTAFQADAFQNDAFQIAGAAPGGGGPGKRGRVIEVPEEENEDWVVLIT